ncbi:MAG TPA: hypothetical protein VI636_09375 [Candidatus Angelobacter sp.]
MAEDWVDVMLTPFGERYVKENGGGPMQVHEGSGFSFTPGQVVRVTRAFDWERVLKNQHVNGVALIQIAPKDSTAKSKAQPKAAAAVTEGGK